MIQPTPGDEGPTETAAPTFLPPGTPEPTDPPLTDPGVTDAGIRDEDDPGEHAGASSTATPGPDVALDPPYDPIATVVIVNYNGAHLLGPCLDGLAKQDMGSATFRTVVVDNASADPSRDLLRDEYPNVELIVSHHNRGFAGGNNLALREIETKYAVLLNNDAVPEPAWLRHLLAPLESDASGRLVATSSKIVFMPRFVSVSISTEAFLPGGLDPRELGIKIYDIEVDGKPVTDKVLFGSAAYGPEGNSTDQYRWSRPSGNILVPLPREAAEDATHQINIRMAAHQAKEVTLRVADTEVTVLAPDRRGKSVDARLIVRSGVERFDVINNVGGIVFVDGTGADRGFEEIDAGQYERAEEVFSACGNGVAIRTAAGRAVGWFDERYFMYYEDVDLSWRLRAAGGSIRYVPDAVLRHIHSASSKPLSPTWLFHVERNRLLTLTKNASGARAAKGVVQFIASTGAMAFQAAAGALKTRRRPSLARVRGRVRVLRSYFRLLPASLRARHQIKRSAVVDRVRLEKWMVTSR